MLLRFTVVLVCKVSLDDCPLIHVLCTYANGCVFTGGDIKDFAYVAVFEPMSNGAYFLGEVTSASRYTYAFTRARTQRPTTHTQRETQQLPLTIECSQYTRLHALQMDLTAHNIKMRHWRDNNICIFLHIYVYLSSMFAQPRPCIGLGRSNGVWLCKSRTSIFINSAF